MSVKVSGLVSGLDTDSIVAELVSAYSLKQETYEKAQTKLEWTMDKWKTTNTKVYSFYSSSLSNMRYSSNYNLKSASISDSSVATISASTSAVASTQSLSVLQLATSGYMTSGEVSQSDGSDVKSTTTLSALGISGGTISVNGTDIDLTSGMTVSTLVSRLKSAGVNASFDSNSQRFFVSSSSSGEDNEFELLAEDADGLSALQTLGLFSVTDTDGDETAEMTAYRALASGTFDSSAEIQSRYDSESYTTTTYTDYIQGLVDDATDDQADAQTQLDALQDSEYDWTTEYDTEADYNTAVSDLQTEISEYQTTIDTNQALLDDSVLLDDAMTTANNAILADITSDVSSEVGIATSIVSQVDAGTLTGSSDSARVNAQDALIKLNGATFNNSSNSFSINGLTISAQSVTVTSSVDTSGNIVETDDPVTITTAVDTQAIYDKIKNFFSEYNELSTYLDTLYYADSSDGYEPLTDDEKESMTDTQIEDWETLIKDSLLRKDSTISALASAMKSSIITSSVTVDDETYTLSSFGIATLSYFTAGETERGTFHIDGDDSDASTSGNTDKLMEAIANNPEAVVSFFQEMSQNLYSTLTSKMASSSISSAFTIYNDKEMSSQYSDYTDDIEDWEERVSDYEDYYYSKFTAMETALSTLNSQSSALSGLLGG